MTYYLPKERLIYYADYDELFTILEDLHTESPVTTWMLHNQTGKWREGLILIQFMKNISLRSGIKSYPYEAMFVGNQKIGLRTSNMLSEAVGNVTTEEDLEDDITSINSNSSQTNMTLLQQSAVPEGAELGNYDDRNQ